jgi:hypothetical protein
MRRAYVGDSQRINARPASGSPSPSILISMRLSMRITLLARNRPPRSRACRASQGHLASEHPNRRSGDPTRYPSLRRGWDRFQTYRRPHGSYSPLVRGGICSLLSLQAATAQLVPALLGIRPGKSPSRQMGQCVAGGGIPAWEGRFSFLIRFKQRVGLYSTAISKR